MVDRCVSVTETETEKVYLADFLKTNLTNSNELRKRKGEKERARRRKGGEEKQAMVALLVFIIPTLEIVFGRKKLSTQKVHLAITLLKIRLYIY